MDPPKDGWKAIASSLPSPAWKTWLVRLVVPTILVSAIAISYWATQDTDAPDRRRWKKNQATLNLDNSTAPASDNVESDIQKESGIIEQNARGRKVKIDPKSQSLTADQASSETPAQSMGEAIVPSQLSVGNGDVKGRNHRMEVGVTINQGSISPAIREDSRKGGSTPVDNSEVASTTFLDHADDITGTAKGIAGDQITVQAFSLRKVTPKSISNQQIPVTTPVFVPLENGVTTPTESLKKARKSKINLSANVNHTSKKVLPSSSDEVSYNSIDPNDNISLLNMGAVIGLGYELKMSDRLSGFADLEYSFLSEKTTLWGVETAPTIESSTSTNSQSTTYTYAPVYSSSVNHYRTLVLSLGGKYRFSKRMENRFLSLSGQYSKPLGSTSEVNSSGIYSYSLGFGMIKSLSPISTLTIEPNIRWYSQSLNTTQGYAVKPYFLGVKLTWGIRSF